MLVVFDVAVWFVPAANSFRSSVLQLFETAALSPVCVLHLLADNCLYLEVLVDVFSPATRVPILLALTKCCWLSSSHTSASFMGVALSCSSFCIATAAITTVLAAPSPTLSLSHPMICLSLKKPQAPQLRLLQMANHMVSQTLQEKIEDSQRVRESQAIASENQPTASGPQPARVERTRECRYPSSLATSAPCVGLE